MKWPGLLLLAAACAGGPAADPVRIDYVTTARQWGPVSFRDPLGVISPDGEFLAWSVQHRIFVRRVDGGPVKALATEPGVILHLAWLPDSRALVAEHRDRTPRWWHYDLLTDGHGPLFPQGQRIGADGPPGDSLRYLVVSPQGRLAGVRDVGEGSELWVFGGPGDSVQVVRSGARLASPFFRNDGTVACLAREGGRQYLRMPCAADTSGDRIEAYGPTAFSVGGDTVFHAAPNEGGTLDLWARPVRGGRAVRLTSFGRDTYGVSVSDAGRTLFKAQNYRTVVGVVADTGGPVRTIAAFQSETPSWDPTGKWIGITYGTWRRVIDDFRYPDIAQDVGIIAADPGDTLPAAPARVVDASPSEDQALTWSPNGRWIAYHSHKEQGDDIWLVPADNSAPPRRLTRFGRGFETGWPRWSPDGKWLLFDADAKEGPRQSVIYVMGLDQETGVVTAPERALVFSGFGGEAVHAEWLGGSDRIAVLGEEAPDRHLILVSTRDGGATTVVHRWRGDHRLGGLATSPDGRAIAFVAPAGEHVQLFRVPVAGGPPRQLTFDPSDKTQPAWSPDGKRIALTVWEYTVAFYVMRGRTK